LADIVVKNNLMVAEDDFGHHFHFTTSRQMPFCVMLPKSNCVYIATFSKILAPALRLGFVTSSAEVINRLAERRRIIDLQGDVVMERSVLELVESGELKRHIRRARKVYQERLEYIDDLITAKLKDKVMYKRPNGGLALWMTMDRDIRRELALRGINAPVFALTDGRWGIRVGYASMKKEEMELLVGALHELL
jgi:GntR family transcriptional regulator/MocR family aminotransferase